MKINNSDVFTAAGLPRRKQGVFRISDLRIRIHPFTLLPIYEPQITSHGSRAKYHALIISVIFISRDMLSRSASANLSKMNLMVS